MPEVQTMVVEVISDVEEGKQAWGGRERVQEQLAYLGGQSSELVVCLMTSR
jgi:hypothetical protein